MAAPPLIALSEARLAFDRRPLFEGLSFGLARGERACLVGRNGSGKSTLLKVLAGLQDLDAGKRFLKPGSRVAYLPQAPEMDDPAFRTAESLAHYVAGGLPEAAATDDHRVAAMLANVDLEGTRALQELSGGEGRRAAIARALIAEPDVLLLDEPTNHLDIVTIEWLEGVIAAFKGALIIISHDRAFLERVARVTLWLDRGRVQRLEKSISHFEAWSEALLAEEADARHKLDRRIHREERWLQRGVTARRKRNQGRLRQLQELRRSRADWLKAPETAKLALASASAAGDSVIEAEGLSKAYDGKVLIADFSTRIRRRDRIGIVGPNGAGKTTLVRLLIGTLAPDSGKIKIGARVEVLYYDQKRENLDPEATLWATLCPDGGDALLVQGRQRHVVAYLNDFLFEDSQVRQPVKALSGGERARLLLARLFARKANLLVLDEPTNDLDLETLDLLEDVLDGFDGTLLLVSHDRDFLDRLATSVIAMEGDGQIREYAGGYSDYLAQRGPASKARDAREAKRATKPVAGRPRGGGKLSYKEQRELDGLPKKISELETQLAEAGEALATPDLYGRDPAAFAATAAKLEALRATLAEAEERWLALEEQQEALKSGLAG